MTDPIGNPPLDQVFSDVNAAIGRGSDLPIPDEIVGIVRKRFEWCFAEQLQEPGRWAQDRATVLNASRQLGVIAAAIAKLRRPISVDLEVMDTAIEVVQKYCEIQFGLGRYCRNEPTP